jgi:lipopolysaccharide transport system ATP-binding protein
MSVVKGTNISVEFPVYSFIGNRSLKKSLLNIATGGVVAKDASDRLMVRALDDVSFEFREGDRVGLLGHNGSGKSTLLQVLAGIYEPTAGGLVVQGKVTSMLGITLGMDQDASGMENIYLRAALMGLTRQEIDSLVDQIIEFADLGEFINMPMRTYSSGMLMRLAFSIATCVDADVILMDEWLSVGDADFVDKAKKRVERMVGNAKVAVIASHNQALIKSVCNVILTLEHGRVISTERVDF